MLIVCLSAATLVAFDAAIASDWGYDDSSSSENTKPLRAEALPLSAGKGGRQATGVTSPFARGTAHGAISTAPKAVSHQGPAGRPVSAQAAPDKWTLLQESWRGVFELAAGQNLDDDQQSQLAALLKAKLAASPATCKQAEAVLQFWPQLSAYLIAHPEQRPNYGTLLKALLRYQARWDADQTGSGALVSLAQDEGALIAGVLGAQSLSVPGTVPFSEDAVNAYADMACFIYEQRNPGKSVDAEDNREIFAHVVSEKFKAAPTRQDKEAMAGFDLVWAKFKIVWTQADDKQKAALLDDLSKSGAGAALASAHDSMLELVLRHWSMPDAKNSSAVLKAAAAPHK